MPGPGPAPSDESSLPRSRILIGGALVAVAAVIAVGWLLLGSHQPREQVPPEIGLNVSQAPLEAAQDALDAWGRFAVTGDLGELDGHFHPDGPQSGLLTHPSSGCRVQRALTV